MTEDEGLDVIDLHPLEVVCPAYRLAMHKGGFSWGVCSDCFAERL